MWIIGEKDCVLEIQYCKNIKKKEKVLKRIEQNVKGKDNIKIQIPKLKIKKIFPQEQFIIVFFPIYIFTRRKGL